MFQTFLTGLREGLEAALIVGIMVAYLRRTGRGDRVRAVWIGVGGAIVLCLAVGAILSFTSRELSDRAEEIFAGITSIIAVAFVTWMVFWMRATARHLNADLQQRIDTAVAMGSGALAFASFLAVSREGLETALFLWPTIRSAGAGSSIGAVAGIAAAVVLGYLLYRRSVNLNLAKFFRWTGIALVIIAAGVLAYGVHELQEAGVIPGAEVIAFDLREQIPPTSWYGSLLKGTVNFNPETSWLQLGVWITYLAVVMTMFLRPQRSKISSPELTRV